MKIYLLSILISFSTIVFASDWKIEKTKIDFLIEEVSKVEGTFIRNGTEHTPKEASKHLNMKLNNALNSWFTPNKKDWTALMFIEKIATKSSLSGEFYLIKLKDGTTVKSGLWLKNKLKNIDK